MAHDGFARAIVPAHTMNDGDTIFAIGTGAFTGDANITILGGLGAEVMADAILRAVREATRRAELSGRPRPHSQVNIYVALLIGYSAALTALGLWIARRVRGPADFFVAGRKLTWPYIAATMLAANIGAGATVGATGLAYQQGVSAWFWNGSAGIGSLLLATLVGPRIWKLAAERGYLTVGDFLDDRYGQSVRVIIASLIWFGALFILAGQLLLGAAVFSVVAGLPKWAGVLDRRRRDDGLLQRRRVAQLGRRQRRSVGREVHGLRDRHSDPDERRGRDRRDRAESRIAGDLLRSAVFRRAPAPASRCCCCRARTSSSRRD